MSLTEEQKQEIELGEKIEKDWRIIRTIENPSEYLWSCALSRNLSLAKEIKNKSEELCIFIVKQRNDAIKYLTKEEQTFAVCERALYYAEVDAFPHIIDPSDDVVMYLINRYSYAFAIMKDMDVDSQLYFLEKVVKENSHDPQRLKEINKHINKKYQCKTIHKTLDKMISLSTRSLKEKIESIDNETFVKTLKANKKGPKPALNGKKMLASIKSIYYFRSLVANLCNSWVKNPKINKEDLLVVLHEDGSFDSTKEYVVRIFNLFHRLDWYIQGRNLEISDNSMVNDLIEKCRKSLPPSSIHFYDHYECLSMNEIILFRSLAANHVVTYGRSKTITPAHLWKNVSKSQNNAMGALATPEECLSKFITAFEKLDNLCRKRKLITKDLEDSKRDDLIKKVKSGNPIPFE